MDGSVTLLPIILLSISFLSLSVALFYPAQFLFISSVFLHRKKYRLYHVFKKRSLMP